MLNRIHSYGEEGNYVLPVVKHQTVRKGNESMWSSVHYRLPYAVEASGQLHGPAALLLEKKPLYVLDKR
jgi:hypothetical protein